jgi:hypothetical protein
MIFFPGPSLIIHLLILLIGKVEDRIKFSLKDKLISVGFLAYLFVFFIIAIVFLSAYILINESFKHETTFTLIRRTLSDNVALAAVEKLPSEKNKQGQLCLRTEIFTLKPENATANDFEMKIFNFDFSDSSSKSFPAKILSRAWQLIEGIRREKEFSF